MRALDYALREGWASLWRARGSSVPAILAIALALVVLGSLLLVTWNIDRLLAEWTSAAELSVFLRDDATSEQRGAIESVVDASGVAAGREYVSKADALSRFRREFTDVAALADELEGNPISSLRGGPHSTRGGNAGIRQAHWSIAWPRCRASRTCGTTANGLRASGAVWQLSEGRVSSSRC